MPHVSHCVYVEINEAYLGQCCSSIAFYRNVGMALEVDSNKDEANLKPKVSVWNPRKLFPS